MNEQNMKLKVSGLVNEVVSSMGFSRCGQSREKINDVMRKESKPLSCERIFVIEQIKEVGNYFYSFLDILSGIEGISSDNKEIIIAKAKLEEAVMWAVKGVSGD